MKYIIIPTNSDLLHFGVSAKDGAPGRGSGRYPLGSGKRPLQGFKKNIKKSNGSISNKERPHTDYNISNWGKSKDTNILFVTGIAGSGKSTIARNYAQKENADLINIDLYTFKTADKYLKDMSKSFNKYLDKKVPNWKDMQREAYEVLTKTDRRSKKPAGKWFDTFESALLGYGEEMYGKKKIVAEGVQLLDETLFYNNKKALKDKPLIVMDTSVIDSILSRSYRDNKSIDKLLEPDRLNQLTGWMKDKKKLYDVLNMKIPNA